jgi:hypothetical protein
MESSSVPAPGSVNPETFVIVPAQETIIVRTTTTNNIKSKVLAICMFAFCYIIFFCEIASFFVIYGTLHSDLECKMIGRSGTEYLETMSTSAIKKCLVAIGCVWMCSLAFFIVSGFGSLMEIGQQENYRKFSNTSCFSLFVIVYFLFMVGLFTTSGIGLAVKKSVEADCTQLMKDKYMDEATSMPTAIISTNITIVYVMCIIDFIIAGIMLYIILSNIRDK